LILLYTVKRDALAGFYLVITFFQLDSLLFFPLSFVCSFSSLIPSMSGDPMEVFCECVYAFVRRVENVLQVNAAASYSPTGDSVPDVALTGLTPPPSAIPAASTSQLTLLLFLFLFGMMAYNLRRSTRRSTPARIEIPTDKPQPPADPDRRSE
jgi:hypothetical protein